MTETDRVIQKTRAQDPSLIVWPEGEIGFARSPQLRIELMQLIQQHQPQRLIVNLAQVPYMDSSGVATLVEAMQLQRKARHQIVLCELQERVRSVFEIARLDMVFTIVDDLDAAVSA